MSLYRTLWILAHTPLVTPEAARQATHGIPLTTFLEYPSPTTPPTTPDSVSISSPSGNNILSLSTSTRTGGPSAHTHADEVAHAQEAFEGKVSDPETSSKKRTES